MDSNRCQPFQVDVAFAVARSLHLLDLRARLCNLLHDDSLLRERLPKSNPSVGTRARELERALGHPDEPHAVVHATGAQPSLRQGTSTALAGRGRGMGLGITGGPQGAAVEE